MSQVLPKRLTLAFLFAVLGWVSAQNNFSPGSADYPIVGLLPGDQVWPDIAANTNGGWLVWQDNGCDGDGLGIRAARLSPTFSVIGQPFTVNNITVGDQERPRVALMPDGGAVIVWQGGRPNDRNIYASFLNSNGTFRIRDVLVNTYTNGVQEAPAVTVLSDGSVLVVWASFGQDGDKFGIFAQRLSASGQKIGTEFQVNQFVLNNQRSPSVCTLPGGKVFVVWVSELQRYSPNAIVDIWGRIYRVGSNGLEAVGNEFLVSDQGIALCANPEAIAGVDGKVLVVWSQNNSRTITGEVNVRNVRSGETWRSSTEWDVYGRLFDSSGQPLTQSFRVNSYVPRRQFGPRGAAFGQNFLVVWVSESQDGSREGIFGQFVGKDGMLLGSEFQINTTVASRQLCPVVGTDGASRFVTVWTQFGLDFGFDLRARIYDLIRLQMIPMANGVRLVWNTMPGGRYQIQSSADGTAWQNVGQPRVATGYEDSLVLTPSNVMALYRVIRVE